MGSNCCLSLYLNIGDLASCKKGPGERFDSAGKSWKFLSVKVWEPWG